MLVMEVVLSKRAGIATGGPSPQETQGHSPIGQMANHPGIREDHSADKKLLIKLLDQGNS